MTRGDQSTDPEPKDAGTSIVAIWGMAAVLVLVGAILWYVFT